MDDLELVGLIKKGDRKAFNLLCRDYYAAFVSYARIFLPMDGAEDVVQDVLLNVWRTRDRLLEDRPVQGYILRSVYNRAINRLSKDKNAADYRQWCKMTIASLCSFYCDPENNDTIRALYQTDLRNKIEAAVLALPPKCQEVFRLSYIEQRSSQEIASELGISVNTVSNHIHKALVSLREALAGTTLSALFVFMDML